MREGMVRDLTPEEGRDFGVRLASVRASLFAMADEAEGKHIIPGVDVARRARTLAALCEPLSRPGITLGPTDA